MTYQPIENYGVIGDLHTVALVGMDGSIDFLCLPHFDSPSVFAALLDDQRGGRFQIAPVLGGARQKQLYLPDTNVLLTRFLSPEGVAEISDFMPVEPEANHYHSVVRRAKTVRGEVHFRMLCAPRFDYARAAHRVEQRDGEVLFVSQGPDGTALRLRSSVPVRVVGGDVVAEFTLRAGETAAFVLEQAYPGEASPSAAPDYVSRTFKETVNFWRRWLGRSTYNGRWREMVHRSALLLKLLTSQTYGSIVAAPTFGLPEEIGGVRNWDYRYTWIRDASFTLYALIRLGYTEEAAAFMKWIEARCGELEPDGSLQVMYGIDGRHDLSEALLPHLEGYSKSAPVRIGNNAYQQLQLDIYGELMDSVYLYNKYGDPISHDLWRDLVRLIDWVCTNWRQPDEGIWETRGGRHEFLYSRVMCWVAVDRGIRLAQKRSFPAPLEWWLKVRDEIYRDIFEGFWDAQRQAFVQYRGGRTLDAASLLMPLVKFISPTDPRWLSTLRAIEAELVEDSLVYRYRLDHGFSDGLHGGEGTFSMCSFWYVECLSRAGDLEKARFYFEKMLGYANHLGLYAEELGPRGEHLGNFPQAFTHLALISAAYDLNRRLSAAGQRA
ncbi:MAG: glucoamylase [Candidatus Tectimicrobiota bacterium]|nr:MAG: glucoamylase [Candidatus Tectomicrobia bacterium]